MIDTVGQFPELVKDARRQKCGVVFMNRVLRRHDVFWTLETGCKTMKITLLKILVLLNGCQSLKEKRRRIRKFRDKWGGRQNVAVIESGRQDQVQHCEWSLVIIAGSQKVLDQSIAQIETELQMEFDGTVLDVHRELI